MMRPRDTYRHLDQAVRTEKCVRNKETNVSEQPSGAKERSRKTIMADKKIQNMNFIVNNYIYEN